MASLSYACYSVDAGIMIRIKDMWPIDLFQPAWDEIERLVSLNRWKIFESVADEMFGDNLKKWIDEHSSAIVKFNPEINKYITKLMAELDINNMSLVDPMSLKNNADPFVVMLALYLEGRDLNNLRVPSSNNRCCVLTREELKEKKVNIPSVCEHYHIPFMTLHDFMQHHQWKISLDIQNP